MVLSAKISRKYSGGVLRGSMVGERSDPGARGLSGEGRETEGEEGVTCSEHGCYNERERLTGVRELKRGRLGWCCKEGQGEG